MAAPTDTRDRNREGELVDQLSRRIADIVEQVVHTPEIAAELAEERLRVSDLMRTVRWNPRVLSRARAEYESVLNWEQQIAGHKDQEPAFWEKGWRPNRIQALVLWPVAVLVPVAWLMLTVLFFADLPAFAQFLDLACLPLVALVVRMGVKYGAPNTTWYWLQWAHEYLLLNLRVTEERWQWRHEVREEVVLPEVREWINDQKELSYENTLTIRDASGLGLPAGLSPLVYTASVEKFLREVDRVGSEALGVAGRRGVGKTTLIERVCRNEFTEASIAPRLTVLAAAPARYDPRDFVLHLHTMVCQAVINRIAPGGRAQNWQSEAHWDTLQRRERVKNTAATTLRSVVKSALLLAAGFGIAVLARGLEWTWNLRPLAASDELLVFFQQLQQQSWAQIPVLLSDAILIIVASIFFILGVLLAIFRLGVVALIVVWLLSIRVIRALRAVSPSSDYAALRVLAERQLRRIRFLQTHTEGWSGKLSSSAGMGFGLTRSVQRTEQALTLPEVVAEFRSFLGRVVEVLVNYDKVSGVIIAIDELDKISDPAEAHRFINEIKGIFGVPNCLFLISVSEDALTSFERRGIPVRDAFDSAFTTMVHIEPFSLQDSRQWLRRRAIGIPEPFICLCHCLSGGLPRDLGRAALTMHDTLDNETPPTLDEVAQALVTDELNAKLHAFSNAAQQLGADEDVSGFLITLDTAPANEYTDELLALAQELLPGINSPTLTALERLRFEAGCFVYFCNTLLDIFASSLSADRLTNASQGTSPGANIHTLAKVQRSMALDPRMSWHLLTAFRTEWGLELINPTDSPVSP